MKGGEEPTSQILLTSTYRQTLSAAFWLWVLLGKKQSPLQMVALLMLLLAGITSLLTSPYAVPQRALLSNPVICTVPAVVLNMGGQTPSAAVDTTSGSMYQIGLAFVAAASMLSGLSATLTQRAVSGGGQRNTMVLSAEMAVYGILFLLLNLCFNNDIKAGADGGAGSLFSNWDLPTLVPVVTNVSGPALRYYPGAPNS